MGLLGRRKNRIVLFCNLRSLFKRYVLIHPLGPLPHFPYLFLPVLKRLPLKAPLWLPHERLTSRGRFPHTPLLVFTFQAPTLEFPWIGYTCQ